MGRGGLAALSWLFPEGPFPEMFASIPAAVSPMSGTFHLLTRWLHNGVGSSGPETYFPRVLTGGAGFALQHIASSTHARAGRAALLLSEVQSQ